jgi:hypothetical protein
MVHNLFNTNAEYHDRVGLLIIRNIQFSNVRLEAGYREVQCILSYHGITTSFPGGGEIFRTCPDRPWGPPSLCTVGTGSSLRVESGRGVTLTPHPLLVPRSRNRVELYLYTP